MNEVTPINRDIEETSTNRDTFFGSYDGTRNNESTLVELFFTALALIWIVFTQFAFGAYAGPAPAVALALFVTAGVTWGGLRYYLFKPAQPPSFTGPLPAKSEPRDDYRAWKDAA